MATALVAVLLVVNLTVGCCIVHHVRVVKRDLAKLRTIK